MDHIRNYRLETTIHEDGMSAETHSVSERFCEHCQRWFEIRGVMGALQFQVDHAHDAQPR